VPEGNAGGIKYFGYDGRMGSVSGFDLNGRGIGQ